MLHLNHQVSWPLFPKSLKHNQTHLLLFSCVFKSLYDVTLLLHCTKEKEGMRGVYASLNDYFFQTVLMRRCCIHECFVCLQIFLFNGTITISLKVHLCKIPGLTHWPFISGNPNAKLRNYFHTPSLADRHW